MNAFKLIRITSAKLQPFPWAQLLEIDHVNNTHIITLQPRMTAINSCIEVDITGQFCSDSIGAGVVTTRGDVQHMVTEYGIANLFGKSLRQSAYELIKIAHPDHRQSLEKAAFKRLKCMPGP